MWTAFIWLPFSSTIDFSPFVRGGDGAREGHVLPPEVWELSILSGTCGIPLALQELSG